MFTVRLFKIFFLFSVFSLPIICLQSCSLLKARAAESSAFLWHTKDMDDYRSRAPFNASWIKNKDELTALKSSYKTIYISEVRTDYLEDELATYLEGDDLKQRTEEARELARYMTERFKFEIGNYKDHPLTVSETPGKNMFILDLSLSKLEPTPTVVNLVGTVAGFVVPGGGLIRRVVPSGSIAIEGVLSDGSTGQRIVEFKDREADKESPFTIRDFQEYDHARVSIDEWAEQFAELAATPLSHTVSDSIPIRLLPI
jgi:hypothetical protein